MAIIGLAKIFKDYKNGNWHPSKESYFITINGKEYSRELWNEINKPLIKGFPICRTI